MPTKQASFCSILRQLKWAHVIDISAQSAIAPWHAHRYLITDHKDASKCTLKQAANYPANSIPPTVPQMILAQNSSFFM
jgi:hypothetical protein